MTLPRPRAFPILVARLLVAALLLAASGSAVAAEAPAEAPEDSAGGGLADASSAAFAALAQAASASASAAQGAAEATGAAASSAMSSLAAVAFAAFEAAAAAGRAVAAAASAFASGIAWLAGVAWSGLAFVASALWSGLSSAAAFAWAIVAGAALWLAGLPGALLAWWAGQSPASQAGFVRAGAASVAVAGAGGLLFGLRRFLPLGFLAPLYTRIARKDALENGQRAAIHRFVAENPGAHPSAIKDALGIGWGTTVYHLDRLRELGFLVDRRVGLTRCYFVNGGSTREEQASIGLLKNDKASAIAKFLAERPRATQAELASALGMSAALVSWHVKRLTDAGVVAKERVGRATALTLVAAGVR